MARILPLLRRPQTDFPRAGTGQFRLWKDNLGEGGTSMHRKAILPPALLILAAAGLLLIGTPGPAAAQYGAYRWGGGYVGTGGYPWGGGYYGGGMRVGDFRMGSYYGGGYYGGGFYPRYGYGYGYGYPYGYSSPYGYAYPYTYSYPSTTYVYPSTTYAYPSMTYGAPQTYVYPSTSSYQPGEPAGGYGASPAPATNAVLVTVKVPENAEVWFGDFKTKATGSLRTFESPPLDPGSEYTYTIRARWDEGGREVNQTQKVDVRSGSRVNVEFPRKGD